MHRKASTTNLLLFALALLVLAGCAGSTKPSRFYVLNTIPEEGVETARGSEGRDIALGIGPVTLPPYLDRPQIVTRSTTNQLQIGEFDRWGEPLNANFSRVLAENLAFLLGTDRIAMHPWQRWVPIDYQIIVRVLRFDRAANGDIVLRTMWGIVHPDEQKFSLTTKQDFSEPLDSSDDYEAVVAAQSRVLEKLSREIAKDILELRRRHGSGGGRTDK